MKILILLFLIGFISFLSAEATIFDLSDETSCLSLSTTTLWEESTKTCFLQKSTANANQLSIESFETLIIQPGIIFDISYGMHNGIFNSGTTINNGTIIIHTLNPRDSSCCSAEAEIENFGTFQNNGIIIINSTSPNVNLSTVQIANEGIFTNNGIIRLDNDPDVAVVVTNRVANTGIFNNHGIVNMTGTNIAPIPQNWFFNQNSVTNTCTIQVIGTDSKIQNFVGFSFLNSGDLIADQVIGDITLQGDPLCLSPVTPPIETSLITLTENLGINDSIFTEKFVSVDVNIGPGKSTINCNSNGVTMLKLFSDENLYAPTILLNSTKFNGQFIEESHSVVHIDDLNNDGLDDAVLHFDTSSVCSVGTEIEFEAIGFKLNGEQVTVRGTTVI